MRDVSIGKDAAIQFYRNFIAIRFSRNRAVCASWQWYVRWCVRIAVVIDFVSKFARPQLRLPTELLVAGPKKQQLRPDEFLSARIMNARKRRAYNEFLRDIHAVARLYT